MSIKDIQKLQSLFQINNSVVQEYLGIRSINQTLIDQLVNCDSANEVQKIKRIEGCKDWDKLKQKLVPYFVASQLTYGKPIHKYIQQAHEDLLIKYHIFYEGLIEFQTCSMLNQYLILKHKLLRDDQDLKIEFRKLINTLIWKTNQLHFVIRIIIGYIAYAKISKQIGNVERVFEQIAKLIEISLKNGANYHHLLFKTDVQLFSSYWNKIIKVSKNDTNALILEQLLQQAQFYFNDYNFQSDIVKELQMLQKAKYSIASISRVNEDTKPKSKGKKPILQINNLMPEEFQKESSKTTNRYLDLGKIVKTEQTQATVTSKRIIKTSASKLLNSQYKHIEEDPIFQIQIENYHINKIVRKGNLVYLHLYTFLNIIERYKTQPTAQEDLPLLTFQDFERDHQDSILELPSPVKPATESEQKISGREHSITHSQSSQGKIDKLNNLSNPYKLKNLIGSRFQQILDIAQLSASSTPRNADLGKSIRRQKTISIKKEHKEFQQQPQQQLSIPEIQQIQSCKEQDAQTTERRRSGMVVSSPDAASQISQAIQKSSLIESVTAKSQIIIAIPQSVQQQAQSSQQQNPSINVKRPQRRNLLTLRTATTFFMEQSNAYIPKFQFSLCYHNRTILWQCGLQITSSENILIGFQDTTNNKIVYRAKLQNIKIENTKNWAQIIEAFVNEYQLQTSQCLPYLHFNSIMSDRKSDNYNFIKFPNYQFELAKNEIEQMGILKDLFRWMYTTYLYEQINITGIRLKLYTVEKDKTLNAYRELINVVNLYRRMIIQSTLSDEKENFHLLVCSYGECIKNNIILLNRILNFKINKQKEQQYMIHKQLVSLRNLSITNDEDNIFFIIRVSIIFQKENILYYKKNDYHTKYQVDVLFEAINSPLKIKPLRLQFDAIEKILEKRYHNNLKQIINQILFSQRKCLTMFYEFIDQKLMINEQKQLQVRMNIFSLHDAQKMEACGMKLGFLIDLQTKVKPFAITEIERYIYDDTQKKLDYQSKSQTIHNREHLFDKHFAQIFGEDITNNEQQHFHQTTLIDLVKRYQSNINTEAKQEIDTKKVGPIVIYQENPFTDVHIDDLEKLESQFFSKKNLKLSQIQKYRIKLKHLSIQISIVHKQIILIYHCNQRLQRLQINPTDEEDNILSNIVQLIQNGPTCWILQMLYKKVSQRALKQSFISSQLSDGFELLKYKKSKSQLAEIPSYNVLHYYILNNYVVLLKYFTLKQFVIVQKIKNYGKYQITIKVFFRCQKPDILAENDYFLMRIDFQNIILKTGMMKMIFNKYDITEMLKIEIPQSMTDANIVQTAMNIFQKCHLGTFTLSQVPFFAANQDDQKQNESQITHNSYEDHSTKLTVQQIRRIGNFPENTTFKKSDLCKGFLEHYIKNSRLIITHIKKSYLIHSISTGQLIKISNNKVTQLLNDQQQITDYVIIQIFRHLLLDIWIVKIYIPKTTRQMLGLLRSEDFKENDGKDLMDSLIIYKKQTIMSFKDLDSFSDITPRQSVNLQKQNHRWSQYKISQFHSPAVSSIQVQNQIGQSPTTSYYLNEFLCLTKLVTDFTEYHLDNGNKEQYIVKEKLIWVNIINNNFSLEQHPKQQNCFLSLLFDQKEINLQELLFQRYIRIERVGESHIEFYMKYSQKADQLKGIALLKGKINQLNLHNNKFPGIISEAKLNEEQIKFLKRTCIFFPFDAISYANTSNFNIELKYFSYNKFTEVKEQINLRELLNLYIADGFYKYQTNYMNSKLNHSDIISICYYMIHKIKTQNFLNLSQYHTIPNLNQLKTQKQSKTIQKPIRLQIKTFKKPYIFIISLLYKELQVTCINWKTCHQINEHIMHFELLLENQPKIALQKIEKIIDKIMNIILIK
ncbi:unnamed protein product (macronuclear) [Paramecium tetraurelia]|uniref:PH domain-containing protein n=1 Tax=Paramecium tetraurelia TaxID=5888 RepID=A0DN92_PARTE|nr:uncharacterized protein GSPATT00018714001 [Paramecium tetraurelia]CAK84509.1 unnamed protein product [Paramecium tetraurelia]|eukprot:XP_001451906.1 hypothetical protein (macronuclear) [Paramecium tetraurelia strain d4-2]